MEPTWTITELAAAAIAALGDEPVRVNGRVRDLPNERLIRWYTTIGLVDPPSGRRGRTALYGERHLLQLVAVKRRQAAGRTIAEIQAELLGATDTALRRIARLPDDLRSLTPENAPRPADGRSPSARAARRPDARPEPDARSESSARPVPPGRRAAGGARDRFWAQAASAAGTGGTPSREQGSPEVQPVAVPGVRLAPGVVLLLETSALTQADLEAIGRAAEPLLAELRRRGLLPALRPSDDPASPTDLNGRHP